jgi:hypothetical protein
VYPDNDHYDSILALLSVSLLSEDGQDNPNIDKAVSKGIAELISEIAIESSWEQKRYRHCLKIVELLTF